MRSIDSKLASLERGFTECDKWKTAKARFLEVLEWAESEYGDEGVKYCLIHFFLDALLHNSANIGIKRKMARRTSPCHAYGTSPADARLVLLLAVQEYFPVHLEAAEELGSMIREMEDEIVQT